VTIPVADDAVIHRIGGAGVPNLRLKPAERGLSPPGFSISIGGTADEAAAEIRALFPTSRKWALTAGTVASATAGAIRAAGFDVVRAPSAAQPDHGRIIHPAGVAGFTDANLTRLAAALVETTGC
jgi:hypothetical protein